MKKTFIILAAAVAAALLVSCNNSSAPKEEGEKESTEATAPKGAIVYFNLDKVFSDYDMANELRSSVESKVQSIQQEINRRGNKLQSDANAFQEKIDKGLITRSVAEVQGQKLQQQQNEFNTYANTKQQEIAEEQTVMMNQLGDAIKKFLESYNADKQYAMIIATQGDILPSPVACGDPSLDITEDIIAGLNAEYVKAKASEKK